jgi:hypothetical protein
MAIRSEKGRDRGVEKPLLIAPSSLLLSVAHIIDPMVKCWVIDRSTFFFKNLKKEKKIF